MKGFTLAVLAVCAVMVSWPAQAVIRSHAEGLPGYQVRVSAPEGWTEAGTLRFGLKYEPKDLAVEVPSISGEFLAIRLRHLPIGMANLDSLRLVADGREIAPERIYDVADHSDLSKKLSQKDFDVINAQGREIEARFPASLVKGAKTLAVRVVGREEDPDHIPGGPCGYPDSLHPAPDLSSMYHYVLGSQPGGLRMDGNLAQEAHLGEPLLKSWTQPISGHPDGYTYGYVKDDGRYLYSAIDFTSDNTYDGFQDFGAVLIQTPQGWKRFQVSVDHTQWGKPGFIYTDKVAYQHKVYEFKIPLADLGVKKGQQLAMKFEAYGTSSCGTSGSHFAIGVSAGSSNPAAAPVFLGETNQEKLMLHFNLANGEGNVDTDPIVITALGSGNDLNDVAAVNVYQDTNTNGTLDGADVLVGTGTFSADNGTATIDITPDNGIGCGSTPPTYQNNRGVFVTYVIKPTAVSGATYQAELASSSDLTFLSCSGGVGYFDYTGSFPIQGGLMTVAYGSTTAADGAKNPGLGEVRLGATDVPMLQFSLTADASENQSLHAIHVTGSGSGDESADVAAVHLWGDVDGSGTVSAGDVEIATSQSFGADDGTVAFDVSPAGTLAAGATKNYLVTYDFAPPSAASLSKLRWLAGRIHVNPQFLFPWTYPLSLSGCGGSTASGGGGGGSGSGVALTGAPAGTHFTDSSGTVITSAQTGDVVNLTTIDGLLILQFTVGTTAVDLTGVAASRDANATLLALGSGTAALVVDKTKSAVSGLPASMTVFVPCDDNDNRVRVCPEETELSDALTPCTNEIRLSAASASIGGYSWDNTDRTGTADCQVSGAPSVFESFLGQGITLSTFKASIAAGTDITLTGNGSTRILHPSGLPVTGGLKTLVAP